MDFHCQYYRKRISLSFTGKLSSRTGKINVSAEFRCPKALSVRCRTTLPSFCARKRVPGKPFATQPERRKKNQTTPVRTNIPETLHRLYLPSRTRRAQFCRLCFADPTFRLPTASLTQNFLVRLHLSGQLKQSRLPRRPRDPPAPAAGRSPVRRSTRAARPAWAGAPPCGRLPELSPPLFPR